MKKSNTPNAFIIILFSVALFSFTGKVSAQEAERTTVQKSFFGVQVGLLEAKALYEFRLSDKFTLRNEFGFDGAIGQSAGKTHYEFLPVFTVEPRFYYSLNKRILINKTIAVNSGPFVSLNTNFNPIWIPITNIEGFEPANTYSASVIPTLGIRKNFSNKINFETAFGFGYRHVFGNDQTNAYGDWAINLRLRIGFDFRVR